MLTQSVREVEHSVPNLEGMRSDARRNEASVLGNVRREAAMNAIREGIGTATISRITGLSEKTIEELRRTLPTVL